MEGAEQIVLSVSISEKASEEGGQEGGEGLGKRDRFLLQGCLRWS